jgi:transcriptional regulator with XRE-family HTH domain
MKTITPLQLRLKLGLNQAQFWSRVGITQSGGSRYEGGRAMKAPVKMLLILTYGTEAQARQLLASLRKGTTK